MGIAKPLGMSLIAFIGLSALFFLIGYGVQGTLGSYFDGISLYPSLITLLIFGPIAASQFPAVIIMTVTSMFGGSVEAGPIIILIGYIIPPLVASILSGRLGETKNDAFLGWFLTAIITSLIVGIWMTIEAIGVGAQADLTIIGLIVQICLGLVYGFGYGCFSLLSVREN